MAVASCNTAEVGEWLEFPEMRIHTGKLLANSTA